MKSIMKNQHGFTFIEIILAIALVGIVAVGLLSGIKFAMETLFASGHYMQKNYVNQGELEDFLTQGTTTGSGTIDSQELEITWKNGSVPPFETDGIRLDTPADSSYLHETIKAYYPTAITP